MSNQRLPLHDLDKFATQPVAADVVAHGVKVSLNFSLTLQDGHEVDNNFGKAPVTFVIGDGNMPPGFETALMGKRAGEQVNALVSAEQAFGSGNPDNLQRFPRYQFPPDMPLSENLLIEFADKSGYKQAGRVVRIGTHDVEIDFNHPLAGKDIQFTAQIHGIDTAKAP